MTSSSWLDSKSVFPLHNTSSWVCSITVIVMNCQEVTSGKLYITSQYFSSPLCYQFSHLSLHLPLLVMLLVRRCFSFPIWPTTREIQGLFSASLIDLDLCVKEGKRVWGKKSTLNRKCPFLQWTQHTIQVNKAVKFSIPGELVVPVSKENRDHLYPHHPCIPSQGQKNLSWRAISVCCLVSYGLTLFSISLHNRNPTRMKAKRSINPCILH